MANAASFFADRPQAEPCIIGGRFQPDAYLRALGKVTGERKIVEGVITRAQLRTFFEMDYHERRDELRAWLTAEILIQYQFVTSAGAQDGMYRWHRAHHSLGETLYKDEDPYVQAVYHQWRAAFAGDVPLAGTPVYVLTDSLSYRLI